MATDAEISRVELEVVAPHPINFIRAVNSTLVRQLRNEDEGQVILPTLLSRAKALVNQKDYMVFCTIKDE